MADASSSGQADTLSIEQRRDKIRRYRYDEGLSIAQIVERLKADDNIEIGKSQVGRDLQVIQREIRAQWSSNFDAVRFVATTIHKYERREYKLLSMLTKEGIEPAQAAALVRAANDCTEKITTLLQDIGVVDRRIGTLMLLRPEDDDAKRDRVPTGEEMQRLFEHVTIKEGEIVSDAERAWLYGDVTTSADDSGKLPVEDAAGE